MAFFSANDLLSVGGSTRMAPPTSGRKLTAVERARVKMERFAEAKAKSRRATPGIFFSENSLLAAQIAHRSLEVQAPETEAKAKAHRATPGISFSENAVPSPSGQGVAKSLRATPGIFFSGNSLPSSSGQGVKRALTETAPASHPCRANAPVRETYTRGSEEGLDNVDMDEDAVEEIRAKELATTTVPTVGARWAWWLRRCQARSWQPLEITPRRLEIAAALLNRGRYRSAPAYISEIKKRFIKSGGFWTQQLDLHTRSLNRALARGQGPPRKAEEIPVEGIMDLPKALVEQARTAAWPAAGVQVVVINAAWLLREIESSAAVLSDVTLHEPEGPGTCGWAEWLLPASKTDPSAQGVTRALACACPSKLCPILALRSVITTSELTRQMTIPMRDPDRHPLICKADGTPLSKDEMVRFYKELSALAGSQMVRITGHSPRVAGAKRMALAGHPIWTIQVFGRWGSRAILGYVREALLGHQGGSLAQQTEQAAAGRGSIKDVRQLAAQAIDKAVSPDRIPTKAKATMVEMLLEHMTDLWHITGPDAVDEIEAEVSLKANEIWAFAELELRVGRSKVIRNQRGKLHVLFNKETCVCGWTWSSQRVEVTRRNLPSAGDTAGWCARCHAWAIAIAQVG